MSDRTGFARGRIAPAIYFENVRNPNYPVGYAFLAPSGVQAKRAYEERFKADGWQWCEADTWDALTKLQKKLIAQETERNERIVAADNVDRNRIRRETSERLKTQMLRSDTPDFERRFIAAWLDSHEDRRSTYEQRWRERQYYIEAVEFDHKRNIHDLMPDKPGEVWRSE